MRYGATNVLLDPHIGVLGLEILDAERVSPIQGHVADAHRWHIVG